MLLDIEKVKYLHDEKWLHCKAIAKELGVSEEDLKDFCIEKGFKLRTKPLKRQNLSGKKFGMLTVESFAGTKRGACLWLCECECGNKKVITAHSLKNSTQSCGCINRLQNENHWAWKGYGGISGQVWNIITQTAKKKNIPIEIDIEYIWQLFLQQDGKCAISGQKLYLPKNYIEFNAGLKTASLDRIDSTKGYIFGNVWWVHKDINWMKNDFSLEYFLKICKMITEYNGG